MDLYIIKEPAYENSVWCKDVLKGLRDEIKFRRIAAIYLYSLEKIDGIEENSIVIVVGSSAAWLEKVILKSSQKVHNRIIVLSNQSHKFASCEYSLVCSDILRSMHLIASYLDECKKSRPALYGINPNSLADSFRTDSFLSIYSHKNHIFYNNSSLQECFDIFYPQISDYDAIICANDYAAISLLQKLKEKEYARIDKLFIISYSDTLLARYYSPSISSVSMNFEDFGKAAVAIYKSMQKESFFSSMDISVKWNLYARETTQNAPAYEGYPLKLLSADKIANDDFYNDLEIIEMTNLENLLKNCDDIDLDILRCIINDETYDEIAEKFYLSTNGVKYKAKNMMELCGVKSKKDFIATVKKYSN